METDKYGNTDVNEDLGSREEGTLSSVQGSRTAPSGRSNNDPQRHPGPDPWNVETLSYTANKTLQV